MDGTVLPDNLIGAPGEIAKYQATGPSANWSVDQITSVYPQGTAFAAADEAATNKLVEYCQAADNGIMGFRNKASTAANAYMENEYDSKFRIESIISQNYSNGTPQVEGPGPAAQSPIADPPSASPPPTILAPGPLGSESAPSGPVV